MFDSVKKLFRLKFSHIPYKTSAGIFSIATKGASRGSWNHYACMNKGCMYKSSYSNPGSIKFRLMKLILKISHSQKTGSLQNGCISKTNSNFFRPKFSKMCASKRMWQKSRSIFEKNPIDQKFENLFRTISITAYFSSLKIAYFELF